MGRISIIVYRRVINPRILALMFTLVAALPVAMPAPTPVHAATQTGQWINISPPVSTDFTNPPNNYGFQTLVMDPSSPTTLYVGTCYQGLWKTTTGGTNWFKVNTGANGAQLDSGRLWTVAIDPFHPQTLYTTAGYGANGLWKSTDGGVDWQNLLPSSSSVVQQIGTSDVYHVEMDPYRPNHLLVSFHYYWNPGAASPGLLESFDGGQSWTVHQPPTDWGAGEYVFFLDNSQTWLVGSQSDGYWRTADSGATWRQVSTTQMSHGADQLFRAANGVLYVPAFGALLRSSDDGQTFTNIGLPENGYFEAVVGDGTTMYMGTASTVNASNRVHFVVSSESDGTAWTLQNTQTFAQGPMSMVYDPINQVIYSSNWTGGVWKLQIKTVSSHTKGEKPHRAQHKQSS